MERLPKGAGSGLDHPIDLSPLVDVLFTHYVGVDEQVSVTNTEMLLTGSTLETLQVVHFVLHPHRHLIGTDPLVTGSAETILTKKPGAKQGGEKAERWSRENRQKGLEVGWLYLSGFHKARKSWT